MASALSHASDVTSAIVPTPARESLESSGVPSTRAHQMGQGWEDCHAGKTLEAIKRYRALNGATLDEARAVIARL